MKLQKLAVVDNARSNHMYIFVTTGNVPMITFTEDRFYLVKILSKLLIRMSVNVIISLSAVILAASSVDQIRLGPKTVARFCDVILFTS